MDLKEKIRSIPDFPIKGVLFRDITTLLKDKDGYHALIETIAESLKDRQVDLVIGPEARGFVIGAALAYALGAALSSRANRASCPAKPCAMSTVWSMAPTCWKFTRIPFSRDKKSSSWTICSQPAAPRLRPLSSSSRRAARWSACGLPLS